MGVQGGGEGGGGEMCNIRMRCLRVRRRCTIQCSTMWQARRDGMMMYDVCGARYRTREGGGGGEGYGKHRSIGGLSVGEDGM